MVENKCFNNGYLEMKNVREVLRFGMRTISFLSPQKPSLGEPENAYIQLSLEFSLAMGKIVYLSDFFA